MGGRFSDSRRARWTQAKWPPCGLPNACILRQSPAARGVRWVGRLRGGVKIVAHHDGSEAGRFVTTLPRLSDHAGNSPVDTDQLVREVDAALMSLHAARLKELGPDASGLYSHYEMLLGRGAILRDYEIGAFRRLRDALPPYEEYAVLRAGLGELAFLIGGAGHQVTAYEPDQRRFEAVMAGVKHLGAANAGLRERLRAVQAYVPAQVSGRSSLGVATDFAVNLPLENDEIFRSRLRQLDALFISPRLFIRTRNSLAEQRAAIEFLRFLGFTRIVDFPEEQMVYAARPAGAGKPTPGDSAHEDDAAATPRSEPGFDGLIQRVMATVPPAAATDSGSTWVERRISDFGMRSAFGSKE